jgi:thiosulfate/3-mercaptopyruvate sulfurtransferase
MSLISANLLAQKLNEPNLRIIDARYVLSDSDAGRQAYLNGHLPGALYVSLDEDLSSEISNPLLGRHPLPSAEKFSALLSHLGINSETQVVVYDQSDGAMAASRFWFLLRLAGHKNATVLDGGLNQWITHNLPLTKNIIDVVKTDYAVKFDATKLATVDQLKVLLNDDKKTVLLDARAQERYRGEIEPIDTKAGHIPGALNRPYSLNLENGLFKSRKQLQIEFAPYVDGKENILLSCGSGVTACHHALALSYAGIENYRLFAPSWSGWIADESNLIVNGS